MLASLLYFAGFLLLSISTFILLYFYRMELLVVKYTCHKKDLSVYKF